MPWMTEIIGTNNVTFKMCRIILHSYLQTYVARVCEKFRGVTNTHCGEYLFTLDGVGWKGKSKWRSGTLERKFQNYFYFFYLNFNSGHTDACYIILYTCLYF